MAHVAKGSCVCLCVSVCVCVRICVCDCSHPVLHHLLMLLPVVSNERCVKSYRYACPCPRTHTHTHTHTHSLHFPSIRKGSNPNGSCRSRLSISCARAICNRSECTHLVCW